MVMEWTVAQSVGHSGVDEDHKALIETLVRLEAAVAGDPASVPAIAAEFLERFERHSAREEELMRRFHYPDTDRHAQHHQFFVSALRTVLRDDPHLEAIRVNLPFIRSAVIDHIERDDRDFGAHLRAIGCYGEV